MLKNCEIEVVAGHRWINGQEGKYSISEKGNIYSYKRNKYLAFCKGSGKFYIVNLSGKNYYIHKLVALVFNNTPLNTEIEFIDGDTDNLYYTNLRAKKSVFLSRIGERYGKLTVVDVVFGSGKPKFGCICECGKNYVGSAADISNGHTSSCGCLKVETTILRNTSHNLSRTSEYVVWQAVKSRCLNIKTKSYNDYGGRGIKVCDRWLESFENFIEDMGERPEGMTIDRINPNGDYNKANCRWVDRPMQGFNQRKRSTNTSGRTGVFKDVSGWRVNLGSRYIGLYKSFDDAVAAREKAELEKFGFIKSGGEYV